MKRLTVVAAGFALLLAGFTGPAQPIRPDVDTYVRAALPLRESSRNHGYLVTRTEPYGSDPSQRVTVLRWSTDSGRRPVAYFVHGGSWVMGSSQRWDREAKVWAQRGWTVVNVSYRLGVDGRLMQADLRTVVQTYRTRPYSDRDRQILVGDSAGAHLATLFAAKHPAGISGVVAWSPIISPDQAIATGAAPGANGDQVLLGRRAAQVWGFTHRTNTPLTYIDADTPPVWMAASANEWVPYQVQGALLCRALGSRCHATVMPGTVHGERLTTAYPMLQDQALAWAESVTS